METTLDQAILKALRYADNSQDISVMKVEDGYYAFATSTIPADVQDDIVLTFKDPAELIGYEVPVEDCDDDFLLEYINQAVIPDLYK